MNKKLIWLKLLMLMIVGGITFGMFNIPNVFAQTISTNNVIATSENLAGTITGEGEYLAGETANLSVDLNAGWVFEGWYHTDENGIETLISMDMEVVYEVISNGTISAKYEQAGIVTGEGYYALGDTVILSAIPNFGWQFQGWVGIDDNGDEYDLTILEDYRTEEKNGEYISSFTATKNMLVKCKFAKLEYSVTLDENIKKDFEIEVINETSLDSPLYYNNKVLVNIKGKTEETGRYIYNLFNYNIFINGNSIEDILSGDNPMNISCNIVSNMGFDYLELSFNIQDNINISISYDYMYKFNIVSANSVDISKIIDFVSINNYSYALDDYTYLIWSKQDITVNLSQGDNVYEFKYSLFDNVSNTEYSKTYSLTKDSELKICYEKKSYSVTFATYIKNIYENYDEIDINLYSVESISAVAGEVVTIQYDESTSAIIVNGLENSVNNLIYGYKIIGFSANNDYSNISKDFTFVMDNTNPSNSEIQILLEYINYTLTVNLVDSYFESFVEYDITLNTPNLNVGTLVTLNATTDYLIKGWSWKSLPTEDDYISVNDTYSFLFEPLSNDASNEYIIYLDVRYNYYSSTFELSSNSIVKNVDYDTVVLDETNNVIEFKDSYNKLATQQITYSSSDVTNDGIYKRINTNTSTFGTVIIVNNQLTYGDGNQYSSIVVEEDGKYIYTFNKYTYMAELQVGVIKYLTLTENNDDITFVVYGDIYSEDGLKTERALQTVSTTKTYKSDIQAYKLTYFYDDLYLYVDSESGGYNYISFRGVNFYYDKDNKNFTIKTAQINTPQSIEVQITKSSSYKIEINNLIADNLLIYKSKASSSLYGFSGHWQNNATLFSFVGEDEFNNSVLIGVNYSNINAMYTRLAKETYLQITDKNAYSDENITFYINENSGSGNVINAIIDSVIIVNIDSTKISKGYQFDGFRLSGADTYLSTDYSFEFIMNSTYVGAVIELCFNPIQYTLKVNYLDEENIIVDYSKLNGTFTLLTSNITKSNSTNTINYIGDTINFVYVNINGTYNFKALSNNGYYLVDAYIGNKVYPLNSLINTNANVSNDTYWTLSPDNFIETIINNANQANEVQLYLQFVTRDYSIKIYFEISSNANAISYPDVVYNETSYKVNLVSETQIVDGVEQSVNKYLCIIDGVKFGDLANISIDTNTLMIGIAFQEWRDANGKVIGSKLPNDILINENKIYTAILQYIRYDIKFVIVDMDEQECSYGIGKFDGASSFILNDNVYYTSSASNGYVLVDTYYYDNYHQKQTAGIENGFIFEPAKYLIEDKVFKIYLQFDLKRVKLSINNTKSQDCTNTLQKSPSEWADLSVLRRRNDEMSTLTAPEDYIFQTNDALILYSKPISLGIELKYVQLVDTNNSIDISYSSTSPYSLSCINIIEGGKIIGVQYRLEIVFNNSMISTLDDIVELNNVFKLKTYNIYYTYNLIDKQCGVKLIVNDPSGLLFLSPDTVYQKEIDYGSKIKFSYDNATISDKFSFLGYELNGVWNKNEGNVQFLLEDETFWNEVATERYNANSVNIILKLKLGPKITLKNTDEDNPYKYTKTYNAQEQSLVVGEDIIVADEFNIKITYNDAYSYPKNAGTYYVAISVEEGDGIWIDFEEVVTFVIVPVKLRLETKYNYDNPLIKVYDGTNSVNIENLINGLTLSGVYTQYGDSISVDTSQGFVAYYQKAVASKTERYNITIYNMYILDNITKQSPLNYVLENQETTFVLNRAGQITARSLIITGFKVSNKVYDGTGEVTVDLTNITYNGVISTDSANIITSNLKFYCTDFSIGANREVKLDFSKALIGADSTNYNVSYNPIYIDIHPYELTMNINGYGEFKLVDYDKKCLIPFNTTLKVNVYDTDTMKYRELYPKIEQYMSAKEKFIVSYEVKLQSGITTIDLPSGLYLYMPEMKKLSKIVLANNDDVELAKYTIDTEENAGMIKIKIGEQSANICLLSQTTYLPLWQILLIVLISGIIIAILILLFIALRNKSKKKYSAHDKI